MTLAAGAAPGLDGIPDHARAHLDGVEQYMRELVTARDGLVASEALRSLSAGGKRLRPLLVLAGRPRATASNGASAGTDPARDPARCRALVRAGAAVELIHTATLVHDDILDAAVSRRGVRTVHAEHGEHIGVAVGDYLFSRAFRALVDIRDESIHDTAFVELAQSAVLRTARVAQRLAEGEELQARQLRDTSLVEADYLLRCEHKTGVLFALALELGALCGGAHPDDVEALGRFGREVGIAFQIADDVLDCLPIDAESTIGKLPGADVRDGTITLPMLRAIATQPAIAQRLAEPVAPEDVDDILRAIRDSGATEDARQFALDLVATARTSLTDLGDRFDTDLLGRVANYCVRRIS